MEANMSVQDDSGLGHESQGSEALAQVHSFVRNVDTLLQKMNEAAGDPKLMNELVIKPLEEAYSVNFADIVKTHYSDECLPSPSPMMLRKVEDGTSDSVIYLLYSQLYYRHLFLYFPEKITTRIRFEAAEVLFATLLFIITQCAKKVVPLPLSWISDIFSDMMFHHFDAYAALVEINKELNSTALTHEERDEITSMIVYNAHNLHLMQHLHMIPTTSDTNSDLYGVGQLSTYCLIELYCRVGQFFTVMQLCDQRNITPNDCVVSFPCVYLKLSLHLCISYIMMQRYSDAKLLCSDAIYYITVKPGEFLWTSREYIASEPLVDQVYLMLLLCHALLGNDQNESVIAEAAEKFPEYHFALQTGNADIFLETFQKAAPSFISLQNFDPKSLASGDVSAIIDEPNHRILTHFKRHVSFRKQCENFFNTAKMYKNIPVQKLDTLITATDAAVPVNVAALKQNSVDYVINSPLILPCEAIERTNDAAVELFIEDDVIVVDECNKPTPSLDTLSSQLNGIDKIQSALIDRKPNNIHTNVKVIAEKLSGR